MFISEKKFCFLNKTKGVTKDGEEYIVFGVIDLNDDDRKYSFVSKDKNVIDKLKNQDIPKLSEITVLVGFENVFNSKTRYSNWQPVLVGVK